ncbi:MAG: PAS sensor protein [Lentimicrobiaceae bacterium]|jgi:DUF438 domain-containing protein|nr:PAS sensor protein [Lentimicrobiaceae bacterium]
MEDFFKDQSGSITVCDKNATVIYQNTRSIDTFSNVCGKSLFDCHPPQAAEKIREMLQTGIPNAYTIEKNGKKKIIYQTAWKNEAGAIAGLIEYSFEIPFDMPHHVRG